MRMHSNSSHTEIPIRYDVEKMKLKANDKTMARDKEIKGNFFIFREGWKACFTYLIHF
jgi:hypothetical protein